MIQILGLSRLPYAMAFCLAISIAVYAQDNSPPKSTEPTPALGNSIVSGRATYEDTGAPAIHFRIMLVSTEVLSKPLAPHRFPAAVTNENGEFNLRKVGAGDYYVVAASIDDHSIRSRDIYPLPTGDTAADAATLKQFIRSHEKISVNGQQNRELNLRVPNPHFGMISGHVFDSSRKPAARALVRLISRNDKVVGGSMLTDENGQYKFLGLMPGDYTICASPPAADSDKKERTPRSEGLLGVTCFPSTLESGNSPPIRVIADRMTDNIDVTLISRNLYSIGGTVVTGSDKRPVSNAIVRLSPKNAVESTARSAEYISSTDKDGQWLIPNLIDGDYHLNIEPRPHIPTERRFVQEELDVTINGADVQGLTIEVSEGASISGIITFEGDKPQSINIGAFRYQPHANSNVRLIEGGPFVLPAVPAGEVELSAWALPQEKFYVKSIESNGQDLLRTNLNIAEGSEITDVRIVVSSSVGAVTGRVLSHDGQPAAKVNVMLRRVGEDKLRLFGGRLVTTTDDQGAFLLSAAPGIYLVVAWRKSDSPSAKASAVDKAMREQSGGIMLGANEKKQIEIRLP